MPTGPVGARPERTTRRTPPPDIGPMIRRYRLDARLSSRGLARAAGIAAGYPGMIESGARLPSLAVACELVRALRIPASDAARLLAVAAPDAGRSSPYRDGVPRRPGRTA